MPFPPTKKLTLENSRLQNAALIIIHSRSASFIKFGPAFFYENFHLIVFEFENTRFTPETRDFTLHFTQEWMKYSSERAITRQVFHNHLVDDF